MARLTNINTGAVVEVRDEKVALLGSEWETVEKPKPAAKKNTSK